ncbi:ABC transporter substrate-binding protein [Lutibacter sp. B2]|nr:ABC transporter substrate-binding protein [Lutibacter sp. B2]
MKNKIFIYCMIACMSLMIATGCSSSDPSESKSQETVEKTPVEGGNVVMMIEQDMDSLDPHIAASAGTKEVVFNIFEGLVKPDEKGELYPAVAERYEISDDGRTYTFTLRKGIKFHNGDAVTVEDITYSLDRVMGLTTGKPLQSGFEKVEKIETADDKTIIIKLKELDASLLTNLTVAILPKKNEGHFKDQPIGTGPFEFVSYAPEQNIIIKKYKDYWKKGIPHVDEVEFRIIPDREAALLSFRAGEIDIFPRLPNDRVEELGGQFTTVNGEQNMVQLMAMNNKRKPFDDIRVRKAMNYAVDVDEVINAVAFGYGAKLGSNMSPVMAKYHQEGLESVYDVNIEKAKGLLKEAGYENGFKTKIAIPSNYPFHVDTGQVIVEQLKKVGIDAQIELVEWGVWLERVYNNRDYDMTILSLTGKLDPYNILVRYQSDYSKNFMNYNNKEYDEIIKTAIKTNDDKKRVLLYKEAQKKLTEDAAAVYIMDPQFTVAMNKNISGYKMYPIYIQDMSSIYYTK